MQHDRYMYTFDSILRLTTVRKWITDERVVREEQRDAGGRPDYVTRHRRVCRPLIITPLPWE